MKARPRHLVPLEFIWSGDCLSASFESLLTNTEVFHSKETPEYWKSRVSLSLKQNSFPWSLGVYKQEL